MTRTYVKSGLEKYFQKVMGQKNYKTVKKTFLFGLEQLFDICIHGNA